MCGRYALYGPRSRSRAESEYFASLEQVTARWGLVPYWSKDEKTAFKCINARAETITTAPAFKGPYTTKRRCLVPACGFYEWQKHPAGKQPYYITSADESLLAFAGLWDA